jgi:hypothetical protein
MSTRSELQILVSSTNKVLKDKVQTMGHIELLRNVHPMFRSDYAFKLLKEKEISKAEALEFIKMP